MTLTKDWGPVIGSAFAGPDEIEWDDDCGYVERPDAGVGLILQLDGTVEAVHLHSGRRGTYARYADELFPDVTFDTERAEVHRVLGPPAETRGPFPSILGGPDELGDIHFVDGVRVHLTYQVDRHRIALVTVTAADWTP